MGQAKARGTFEERKAKAIGEGRVKVPAKRWESTRQPIDPFMSLVVHMAMMQAAGRRRRK